MANSVIARFNDDCKVFVSMSDDTTVDKAVIIDADGKETDIGSGGGSSDITMATVTLNITPPEGVTIVEEGLHANFIFDDVKYAAEYIKADNHVLTILINTKEDEPAIVQNLVCIDDNDNEYIVFSNIQTSSNITYLSDQGTFIVEGDGTITADISE